MCRTPPTPLVDRVRHRLGRWTAVPIGLVAVVAALTGCGDSGLSAAAKNDDFSQCMHRVGIAVQHSGDWSGQKRRSVMSRAPAQRCALDELDPGQLGDLMSSTFTDAPGKQRMTALRAFIAGQHTSTPKVAEDVGRLLAAQSSSHQSGSDLENWDWSWNQAQTQRLLAVAIYAARHEGHLPGFAKFQRSHAGGKGKNDQILMFYTEQESPPVKAGKRSRATKLFGRLEQIRGRIVDGVHRQAG